MLDCSFYITVMGFPKVNCLKRRRMISYSADMELKIQLISYHGPSHLTNFYFPIIVNF